MVWGSSEQRNPEMEIQTTQQGAAQMQPHRPLRLESGLFRKELFQTSRAGGLESTCYQVAAQIG